MKCINDCYCCCCCRCYGLWLVAISQRSLLSHLAKEQMSLDTSVHPSVSHFVVSLKKALFDKSIFEMFNSAVFAMPQKPSGPFTGHTVASYNSYTASKSVRSHQCCIRRERQTQSSTNPNENEKKFLLRNHCICMHAYTD